MTGVPVPVNVRRWWCDAHKHMASPGDLSQRDTGVRLSPAGIPVEFDPVQAERDRLEAEAREARHQAVLEARRYEAEQARLAKEARDEAFRRELPESFRRP